MSCRTFLLLAIRAMLPANAVATLEIEETPYAISKTAIRDSNEAIGALFKVAPAQVLANNLKNPMCATRLSLMMAIATEYLPKLEAPPLYINSDIGPARDQTPAIFVCANFDCGMGDTIVVVAPGQEPKSFTCATSAVIAWAQSDPRATDLFTAATQPHLLDPGSVFRRITAPEA